MADPLVIYGATGYSGRLLTEHVCKLGMRPVLSGRDGGKLERLASRFGLDHRLACISEPAALDDAFRDTRVVLNAAGPFSKTAEPIADACLRTGAHYLDITAEVPVIERLAARDGEARKRQVTIMPAVGFDVVPTDCLAAHVARRLPDATRLAIAVTNMHFVTRGSARTLFEAVDFGIVRRAGVLTRIPLGSLERSFDYGAGPRPSLNVSLGDLVTAYYTTGIPCIETYVDGTPLMRGLLTMCRLFGPLLGTGPAQATLAAWAELLPEDPGDDRDAAGSAMGIVAEAENDAGQRAKARLRTPEAYAFTRLTAAAVAQRVLNGDLEVGFQTAARVYGSDFVLSFPGVTREDVA